MAFGNFFQTISVHEVLMFLAIFILFVLLGMFFHYNTVQLRVQKESKCLLETQQATSTAVYTATAKVVNRPAFQVSYDTLDKSAKIECACADGNAESVFTNIPYYDLRSTTPDKERVQYKDKLLCNCESSISAGAADNNVSYYGEPGIARFMYDQKNTGFFDTLLYGSDYEYVGTDSQYGKSSTSPSSSTPTPSNTSGNSAGLWGDVKSLFNDGDAKKK